MSVLKMNKTLIDAHMRKMFINGKTIRKSEYFAHDFVLNLWHMAILAKSTSG